VLDALEQAIASCRLGKGLIHHNNRGVQYLSIRYSRSLVDVDIQPSVGCVGSSYDNALAETVIDLYKAEVIRRHGPWHGLADVEFARWTGSTGSTTSACSGLSAISHQLKPRATFMRQSPSLLKRHNPNP